MLIIGCDYHPGFQQIHSRIPAAGNWVNDAWRIAKNQNLARTRKEKMTSLLKALAFSPDFALTPIYGRDR